MFGGSAGALPVLERLLARLSGRLDIPLAVVMHTALRDQSGSALRLSGRFGLPVMEAEAGMRLEPGRVYLAPAHYHLLIEKDSSIALSVDARVSYARPSIDVAFDSAAFALREAVIGLLVSGSNDDGAQGLARIYQYGGAALVQSPEEAASPKMPAAGLKACPGAHCAGIDALADQLIRLSRNRNQTGGPDA